MKFAGEVGFWIEDEETSPGVYQSHMVTKHYYGNVKNYYQRWQEADQENATMKVSNQISILSDLFAQQHFASIKYVIWNGQKLKVTAVQMNYPRLNLTIGGVYNGEDSPTTP